MTKDLFINCSSGMDISCIVACNSLVDKPSNPSLHLVLSFCTVFTISVVFVGCMKKATDSILGGVYQIVQQGEPLSHGFPYSNETSDKFFCNLT